MHLRRATYDFDEDGRTLAGGLLPPKKNPIFSSFQNLPSIGHSANILPSARKKTLGLLLFSFFEAQSDEPSTSCISLRNPLIIFSHQQQFYEMHRVLLEKSKRRN
jgi:hypothetical protein